MLMTTWNPEFTCYLLYKLALSKKLVVVLVYHGSVAVDSGGPEDEQNSRLVLVVHEVQNCSAAAKLHHKLPL